MDRGRFITFEGGEGAGKSTQIALLAAHLEACGLSLIRTREPGGSLGAEQIRQLLVDGAVDRWDPLTETLLHMAARRNHLETVVQPALASGTWILCDRFADSTEAYQGYGQGIDLSLIRILRQVVVGDCEPDLTVMLDIAVDTGLGRAHARDETAGRYERMDTALHQRIRDAFLSIAASAPERCIVVDADAPIETIQAEIRRCVDNRFGLKPVHGH